MVGVRLNVVAIDNQRSVGQREEIDFSAGLKESQLEKTSVVDKTVEIDFIFAEPTDEVIDVFEMLHSPPSLLQPPLHHLHQFFEAALSTLEEYEGTIFRNQLLQHLLEGSFFDSQIYVQGYRPLLVLVVAVNQPAHTRFQDLRLVIKIIFQLRFEDSSQSLGDLLLDKGKRRDFRDAVHLFLEGRKSV